jgi:hypothetical protein
MTQSFVHYRHKRVFSTSGGVFHHGLPIDSNSTIKRGTRTTEAVLADFPKRNSWNTRPRYILHLRSLPHPSQHCNTNSWLFHVERYALSAALDSACTSPS